MRSRAWSREEARRSGRPICRRCSPPPTPPRARRCSPSARSCHTIDAGRRERHRPEPLRHGGQADRQAAPASPTPTRSQARAATWTSRSMDEWLASPQELAPGTKMSFAGLSSAEDRANVIVYLNAQGSNLPLPAAPAAAAPEAASAPAGAHRPRQPARRRRRRRAGGAADRTGRAGRPRQQGGRRRPQRAGTAARSAQQSSATDIPGTARAGASQRPLNPCAMTYHSDEPLRLAGGLACLTVVKCRLSSASSSASVPPASTLATKAPPGASVSTANSRRRFDQAHRAQSDRSACGRRCWRPCPTAPGRARPSSASSSARRRRVGHEVHLQDGHALDRLGRQQVDADDRAPPARACAPPGSSRPARCRGRPRA